MLSLRIVIHVLLFRITMLLYPIPSASNIMNLKAGRKIMLNSRAGLGWCPSRCVQNLCTWQAIEMKGETVQADCVFIYWNLMSQELFGWIFQIICYFEPFSNRTGRVRIIWQEIVLSDRTCDSYGPETVFKGDSGDAWIRQRIIEWKWIRDNKVQYRKQQRKTYCHVSCKNTKCNQILCSHCSA